MGDVLGRIFMAIFGSILLFIMPVVLIAQKQDLLAQTYIDNAVVEFVDNARASGKITYRAYEQLCNKVDAAHMLCDIRITHSAAYVVPTSKDENGYFDTEVYHYDYTKEDILNKIYPEPVDGVIQDEVDYPMKNGDYLKVEVKNISPTLGVRMARMVSLRRDDATLYSSYGGYVGNNKQ